MFDLPVFVSGERILVVKHLESNFVGQVPRRAVTVNGAFSSRQVALFTK
jgi:hypothetical protein